MIGLENLVIEARSGTKGGHQSSHTTRIENVWRESLSDMRMNLKPLEKFLTRHIQKNLKTNNRQFGYLQKTGANFFKTSIRRGRNVIVTMFYNFPVSKYGDPKLQYAFPLGNPKNLTRNTDAIRLWLKQKDKTGQMSVYYLSKTKDGYTKKPATKEWHFKSAARSITYQGQKNRTVKDSTSKKYRPKRWWYRADFDNSDFKVSLQNEINRWSGFAARSFKSKNK